VEVELQLKISNLDGGEGQLQAPAAYSWAGAACKH